MHNVQCTYYASEDIPFQSFCHLGGSCRGRGGGGGGVLDHGALNENRTGARMVGGKTYVQHEALDKTGLKA